MKKIVVFLCLLFLFPYVVKAEDLSLAKSAKSVILLEPTTGKILYERNSNERLHPASMTKMMSMLLIIESIENGIIDWDDMVTVSENASSMGGSQILLEANEKMKVEDLFKGVAIASGNDAVVALAEKISGTEEAFVKRMNERAKELGLKNTSFKNPHGLDAANHYSSAYDMAMIAKELVKHEKVLEFTSVYETYLRENTDRKIWLVNTNKLVRFYDGVDGLKTGYTKEAGYCLTATAKKGNTRFIVVVMGEEDSKKRNQEVTEVLDYAFAQYEVETLISKDTVVGKQKIEKGVQEFAEIVPLSDVTVLNKKGEEKVNTNYQIDLRKINAPMKKGEVVGTITLEDKRVIELTVKNDLEKANLWQLYLQTLKDIITGDIRY